MLTKLFSFFQGRGLHFLLLLVLLMFPVGQVVADDYLDPVENYRAFVSGSNTITINVACYNGDGGIDSWIYKGVLTVKWKDDEGNEHTAEVLKWEREKVCDDVSTGVFISFSTQVDGEVTVDDGKYTIGGTPKDCLLFPFSGEKVRASAVWRLPYEMMSSSGSTRQLNFSWSIGWDINSPKAKRDIAVEPFTLNAPASAQIQSPVVTTPIFSTNKKNTLEVPWFIASSSLTKAEYKYEDKDNTPQRKELPTTQSNGTIEINADEPYKNFQVVVSYRDNNDYEIPNRASEKQNLAMIHCPVDLTAKFEGGLKSKVRLDWKILYPNMPDIVNTDFFEVQRSLTGKEEDFEMVGTVPFVLDSLNTSFTFTDSTIVQSLIQGQLTNDTELPNLTYRIRRTIATDWGWDDNVAAKSVKCPLTNLHLQRIASYKAEWVDEKAFQAKVTWEYEDANDAVWDNRAQLKLRIVQTNRAGEQVHSQDVTLTDAERLARSKEITLTTTCVNYTIEMFVDPLTSPFKALATGQGDLPEDQFYHQATGHVSEELKTMPRQSSVVLTWTVEGGVVDYYQVLRRPEGGTDDDWTVVADMVSNTGYEDDSVSPLGYYEYKVRAITDCEGHSESETNVSPGSCKHTGRVTGYVRLQDGTGVAGISVQVASGSTTVVVKTDSKGYYVAEDLPYQGKQSITYTVQPLSDGSNNIQLEVDQYAATFDASVNDREVHEFTITNSYRFSGFVMYNGTSIPVKGARFLVNGQEVHDFAGKVVETGFDGSFSFRVLSGKNTIQAVMDDHTFTQDGYFKSADGYVFTDHVDQIYFYDDTKVKVTGRIVGGDDQGQLPLDHNLSRNNLGRNLTMVLTLEGDNTSWLIYDNQNPELSKRIDTFDHPGGHGHQTKAIVQRKRMEVTPDSVTGEFVLMLPPVRWKVQQIYCDGYPSLFQDGQVSEVIDLTASLKSQSVEHKGTYYSVDTVLVENPVETYNYCYRRIYHNPVEITYRQVGYDGFEYFGDKSYYATNLNGDKAEVPLAYYDKDKGTQYTFGYPVFSVERKYGIDIAVVERYFYNNDERSNILDIVQIGGGKVTVQNGMKNGLTRETVQLDSLGHGRFILTTEQTTRLLTGEEALRTITMTLEQDGITYEAEPLRGFILNMFPLGNAKDVISSGQPVLFDILRDPPGSNSSATLSKGSTLKYSYDVDMKFQAGFNFAFTVGQSMDNYSGVVAGGTAEYGQLYSGENYNLINLDVIFSGAGHRAYSYTMNVNQDISTSSSPTMVGADADLYIGLVQNIVVTPMSTIRAIPDDQYRMMLGRNADSLSTKNSWAKMQDRYGSLVHIAQGVCGKDTFHLVRDESLGYGPKVESQFVHSQRYIIQELIPQLAREIYGLLFTGTPEEADALAKKTQKPVYLSLVPPTDPEFGDSLKYTIVYPTGQATGTDEIKEKISIIQKWLEMIKDNEAEKLSAYDLVSNYSVDGATTVSYSESFESDLTKSSYMHYPFATTDYFGEDGANSTDKLWAAGAVLLQEGIAASILKLIMNVASEHAKNSAHGPSAPKSNYSALEFSGLKFGFSLVPVFEYSSNGTYGSSNAYSRNESFNLSMNGKSHLNVDVYRVKNQPVPAEADLSEAQKNKGIFDVYSNQNFENGMTSMNSHLVEGLDLSKAIYSRGFVYRTRGGATCNPWEDERRTLLHNPGTVLDARTKKIVNPKIKMDRQSISGVSMSDPARFKVYLTNESEEPEAISGSLCMLNLYLDEASNPHGAKVYVDGTPLNSNGIDVYIEPGQLVQKTIEVYAADEFDYDSLMIVLTHTDDWVHVYDEAAFDVHYLHEAGPVNISVPGERWIMNTDAQYDEKRGWFIPVTIDGFNKHQHNFDHIEFQYKESQRGDSYWTNLCSFYADSLLMAAATGVRKLIPENGNIRYDFYGDGPVTEMAYDLRAVLYCRGGNSFLTTPSKIISGVKDTRRPQLFGTPDPTDGIISLGDNIVFNFSEDIEYNYLNKVTHFEVKGEVNNDNVSEMVSLEFNGQASVESEAERNFSAKDLTIDLMVKPAVTGREMPLFSHGTNGRKLQLWLTEDFRLKAVVDNHTYETAEAIATDMFTQVAMVITAPSNMLDGQDGSKGTLTFYNGGKNLGSFALKESYNSTGALIFGRTNDTDRSQSQYYEGRMMEARLWYRALDAGLLSTTYGSRRLSGYEMGLVDYYPMNEGTGDYALDWTQGANATLMGATWARPRGLSLKLDGNPVALTQDAISRTKEQDYTLMFWFKTNDTDGTLVSNGRGITTDEGSENLFYIGLEKDTLLWRSNGMRQDLGTTYCDGQWHHYAMTVNRSRGVANFYMDQALIATIDPDSLGGISGGYPCIGKTRYAVGTKTRTASGLEGHIDELCFFAQALPKDLIDTYSHKSPGGDEAGLLTYLSFDRQERQKDNEIQLVAYPYSKKIYLDAEGNIRYQLDPLTQASTSTPMRDYLFEDSASVILSYIDASTAAPVVPYEELKNLKFSYVGKGNQLLVKLDEQTSRLNHRNVYVTVREIEDKNGNAMASPQTACFYVSSSSLKWMRNRMSVPVGYGSADNIWFDVVNKTATSHTYTIKNCPRWLTLSSYTDVIPAQSDVAISGVVNPGLNIGTYDEILYLVDEDGVAEPLYLTVEVSGNVPNWSDNISSDILEYAMNISGKVYLNGQIDIDPRDVVGVFDSNNRCHGIANITYSALTGESNLYMTVYDNKTEGRELYFKLWQYSTGNQFMLTVDGNRSIKFSNTAILGTDEPVRFEGGTEYVQTFELHQGWNWLSFNVASKALLDLNNLLAGLPWKLDDMLTDLNSPLTLTFNGNQWIASAENTKFAISNAGGYAIKISQDVRFPIAGNIIKDEAMRTITLKHGWNGIGYTPIINLTVETALSDYYDKAQPGDVIKSQNEFAYFTNVGGTGRWRGSLQYLRPGEGYMFYRNAHDQATFRYPYYEPGSTFVDEFATTGSAYYSAPRRYPSTMNLTALVDGVETQEGDLLVAYAGGDVVGTRPVTSQADEPIYLNVSGDNPRPIWFAIERDGDIVAHTSEVMTFRANEVVGTPDEPTAISFVTTDKTDDLWYTIGGVRLPGKPRAKGVYLFNGKKVLIK